MNICQIYLLTLKTTHNDKFASFLTALTKLKKVVKTVIKILANQYEYYQLFEAVILWNIELERNSDMEINRGRSSFLRRHFQSVCSRELIN